MFEYNTLRTNVVPKCILCEWMCCRKCKSFSGKRFFFFTLSSE